MVNTEKLERIKRLKEISSILKEEFVGLDSIIDEIISSITPWYVTPEIIERPIIISLWGMTGTGKSSVVRRLIELLDLKDKSLFVDCGEITGDGGYFKLADRLSEFIFGENDPEYVTDMDKNNDKKRSIFIFDEFQYARTLGQAGEEIEKAAIRPVWNLVDSGKLDYNEWEYGLSHFKQFSLELSRFVKTHYKTPIENCILSDPETLQEYINELGFFFYDRNPVDIGDLSESRPQYPWQASTDKKEDEEKKDPYAPLNLLALRGGNPMGIIYKSMNRKAPGEGKKMLETLLSAKTLGEFYTLISEITKYINSPKIIDCSQSLVFVIGNLDEAFEVEGDTSPDLDADIFNDITSKVTISDIKKALQARFRAEQIARLGNNLIKYPTLRKEDFKEIIRRETKRIFDRFEEETKIHVTVEEDVIELLYSEGVFPTQGVRPVFTTIITLLTPILSEIVIWSEKHGSLTAVLKTWNRKYPSELGFRVPETSLIISAPEEFSKEISKEVELKLQLGALRYPGNRTRRFSSSVHEIGHAILSSWCKGIIPVNIVGVDTEGGGFCDTYDKEKDKELQTVLDIKNEIMISMAGWCAEKLVFGNESEGGLDNVTMGAGSDINRAWKVFVNSVYSTGMFGFDKWAVAEVTPRTQESVPNGFDLTPELESKMKRLWRKLEKETIEILKNEKALLKEGAIKLAELGSISQDQFEDLIKTYGKELTLENMKKVRDRENWFEDRLKNF